jgi:ATP-binding cassette, subfamily F, member 3
VVPGGRGWRRGRDPGGHRPADHARRARGAGGTERSGQVAAVPPDPGAGGAERGRDPAGTERQIGYYAQQHETLQYERTILDTVRLAGNMSEENAVAFLNRFLFNYEHSKNRVGTLSGGERSRLQMALLMLSGANFLMLDEPTNHLDINSAEVLEKAIGEFEGTVLVISHDRYFLDRVVDRIVELDEGYQGVKRS